MIAIKAEDFGTFLPGASPQQLAILATAPEDLAAAGLLENPLRLCHFLAQVMTESAQLKHLSENLNYSADRLKTVWPSHFPSDEVAAQYAGHPEKLANFIYGETSISKSLGNTEPGDGYKFRGRGLFQITGRSNYTNLGNLLGMPLADNPDLASDPATALKVAIGYWNNSRAHSKTYNELADADDVEGLTRAINGGVNGLDDRKAWLTKAKGVWLNAATAAGAGAVAGAAATADATIPTNAPAAAPAPSPAPTPPASTQAPPKPTPQAPAPPAPKQAPGTTLSAIVAFLAGAVAFLNSLFTQVHDWLHAQRVAILAQYHVDILWVAAGVFVVAIVVVIIIRAQHKGAVKKAAAAS